MGVEVGVATVLAFGDSVVNDTVLASLLERSMELLAATCNLDAPGVVVDGSLAGTTAALRVGTGPSSSAGLAAGLEVDSGSGGDAEESGGNDGEPGEKLMVLNPNALELKLHSSWERTHFILTLEAVLLVLG